MSICINEIWTSMSICINQMSAPSRTHALQQCSRPQYNADTGIMHAQISPCQIPQACIPLSYAAKIPTTPNPDLANVRVSLSNLDQEVRKCSVRYFVSIYVSRCMCDTCMRTVCGVHLFLCGCVLICMCDGMRGG